MSELSELIESFYDPRWQHSKRMRCPHCGRSLPIDARGECDQCGAHLRVVVETMAPPQGEVASSQGGDAIRNDSGESNREVTDG